MRVKGSSLRRKNLHLGSHAILIAWCLVVFFPLWVLITGSFKGKMEIYQNPFGLPAAWQISNYTDVLASGDFFVYFKNSFMVVVVPSCP